MLKDTRHYPIVLSLAFSLLCSNASLAQKHAALKAIDPSQAEYDTPPPAPPAPTPQPAPYTDPGGNPFGSGIQGQPLGQKRTLANPNPPGAGDDAGPGIPSGAGQGWSPPADNNIDDKRVTRLEQMTFGTSYPEHEVDDRLDHLESEIFNKKYTGSPADQRLARLESKLLGQTAFSGGAPGGAAPSAFGAPSSAMQPAPAQRSYNPIMQSQFNPMPPQQYTPAPANTGMPAGLGPPGMGQPGMPQQMMQQQGMPQQGMPQGGMPPYMGQSPPVGQSAYMQQVPGAQAQQMGMQQSWNQRPASAQMQGFGAQAPQINNVPSQTTPPYMVPQGGMPVGNFNRAPYAQPPQQQPVGQPGGGPPFMGQNGFRPQQQYGAQQSAPPAYMQQAQGQSQAPFMGQQGPQAGAPVFNQAVPSPALVQAQQGAQGVPPYMMPPSGQPAPMGQGTQMPPAPQNAQMAQPLAPYTGTPSQQAPNTIAQAPPSVAPHMAPPAVAPSGANGSSSAPPAPPVQDAGIPVNQSLQPASQKRGGLTPADRASADISNIINSIPQKPAAGDYLASVSKFTGGTVARWTNFPVLIHLPLGSPANWHKTLQESVESWGKYIPVRVAEPSETADIEIAWINHLPPRALGQTNLEVFNGRMRVTVYLLRPSYYLPGTSDKVLRRVTEHEVGHAIGIFGHSSDAHDLMYPMENVNPKDATKYEGITARDLNTLRKIYESNSLPAGFQSPHPMGWSLQSKKQR